MTTVEYKHQIRDHLARAYMLSDDKIDIFLPNFLTTLQTHLDNLQRPVEAENLEELSRAAHTLKGALLNLGLKELADVAYQMELQSKAGDRSSDYQSWARQLAREISIITTTGDRKTAG